MFWLLLIPAVCIALCVAFSLFAVWPGAPRKALRRPFYGRSYAHRGLFTPRQDPPENSLPAFAAAARQGYGIELDVQFTQDRQLVVFHDDTLDRMTPARGGVRSTPWPVVSALPLAGSGEHAPLFDRRDQKPLAAQRRLPDRPVPGGAGSSGSLPRPLLYREF